MDTLWQSQWKNTRWAVAKDHSWIAFDGQVTVLVWLYCEKVMRVTKRRSWPRDQLTGDRERLKLSVFSFFYLHVLFFMLCVMILSLSLFHSLSSHSQLCPFDVEGFDFFSSLSSSSSSSSSSMSKWIEQPFPSQYRRCIYFHFIWHLMTNIFLCTCLYTHRHIYI